MLDKHFEIVVHILFKVADGFGAECVGDGLAFPSVLGTVTSVEEAAFDRYEGVIVLTVSRCQLLNSKKGSASSYLFRKPLPCP